MDWEGNQGDITFHNSFQNYLWVTLAKQVKEFYEHNLKILKSETEEVTKMKSSPVLTDQWDLW